MIVRAPNFFRWNGDGAQWNAGTGWVAYNVLGWRNVNVIEDDYSFGWTSAAGFIAEFCALGGNVTKRVLPPLNTTDYSSYVAQLDPPEPDRRLLLDGRRHGHARRAQGVRAEVRPDQLQAAHGQPVLGHAPARSPTSVSASPARMPAPAAPSADVPSAAFSKFLTLTGKTWNQLPPLKGKATVTGPGNVFFVNYYNNARGLIYGLKKVKGDLSGGQKALQKAMAKVSVVDPNGYTLKLDNNRQAIADTFVAAAATTTTARSA